MNFVFYDSLFTSLEAKDYDKLYYWNKKRNKIHKNSFDLKDIFLFFGINDLYSLCKFLNHDAFLYQDYSKKIKSILKSYQITNINTEGIGIDKLVPYYIIDSFLKEKETICKEALNYILYKPYGNQVVSFFLEDDRTDILNYFNFEVKTREGVKKINLDFASNFRFKSAKNCLNLFTCPTEYRKILIPQNKNSFLYSADFRQFEFRTFLLINDIEVNFEDVDLYGHFSRRFNLDIDTGKEQIISYMYGKKNEKLDSLFNKEKLLSSVVHEEFFSWDGLPLVLNLSKPAYVQVHTIVQTISQYILMDKLQKIRALLANHKSSLIYPLHDEIIFSIDFDEKNLVPQIREILQDDVYKIKEYVGPDLLNMRKL